MKLSIIFIPYMTRCWMLKRDYGEYEQHAHFYSEKDAKKCRRYIDRNKYPKEKKFIYPMKRILTEQEFKQLKKKQKYYRRNYGNKKSN